MLETIEKVFQSPAGSFAFVFGILVLAFWATTKITKILADHSTLAKSSAKVENHIDDIRKDLSYLKGAFETKRYSSESPLVQRFSPLSLTEKGKLVAAELKIEELVTINWDKIRSDIDKNLKDKNAYDIQQYCIFTASVSPEDFLDKDSVNTIKLYAFKNGAPLHIYAQVLGIVIRNRYFKEKGIDIAEVDEHDPNKGADVSDID